MAEPPHAALVLTQASSEGQTTVKRIGSMRDARCATKCRSRSPVLLGQDDDMTRSRTARRLLVVACVAGLLGLAVSAAVFARSHSPAVG